MYQLSDDEIARVKHNLNKFTVDKKKAGQMKERLLQQRQLEQTLISPAKVNFNIKTR